MNERHFLNTPRENGDSGNPPSPNFSSKNADLSSRRIHPLVFFLFLSKSFLAASRPDFASLRGAFPKRRTVLRGAEGLLLSSKDEALVCGFVFLALCLLTTRSGTAVVASLALAWVRAGLPPYGRLFVFKGV
jgi:hypothetical protein